MVILTSLFCGFTATSGLAHAVIQEAPNSPHLVALQRQLRSGERNALENFWQQITRQGTPLIERIEGDNSYMLVTFLWRANENIKSVIVVSSLINGDLTQNRMLRLLDTDLWHKTYRLRNDARFSYRLSAIRLDDAEDVATALRLQQVDPLNLRPYTFPKDDETNRRENIVSVVELPAAPPQPYVMRQSGVPSGRVELHRLRSRNIGDERRIWIYTPSGYTPNRNRYALLVLSDGWFYTSVIPTPIILDNLIAQGKIPPLVAVMIDNPEATRFRDLACNPSYLGFLTQELLRFVRQRYRVTSNPSQAIIGGLSVGGLTAAFAGLRHPEIFGNVLSQSGSFWWMPNNDPEPEWMARQLLVSPKLPLRFYIEVGLGENLSPINATNPTQIMANRHLRNILQAKDYSLTYSEFNGGHDFLSWRGTLADGLIALIGTNRTRTNAR